MPKSQRQTIRIAREDLPKHRNPYWQDLHRLGQRTEQNRRRELERLRCRKKLRREEID